MMTTDTKQRLREHYDAGLLNDFGGGDVDWWQDYIRAELERSHDFYSSTIDALEARVAEAENAWTPIEQMPEEWKDGRRVDLWVINHLTWNKRGERITNRKWGPCLDWLGREHDGWGLSEDFEPTHVRPLPSPPAQGDGA